MAAALGCWLRDQMPSLLGACGTVVGTALSVVWGVCAWSFSTTGGVAVLVLAVTVKEREKVRNWRESWKVARLEAGNIVPVGLGVN